MADRFRVWKADPALGCWRALQIEAACGTPLQQQKSTSAVSWESFLSTYLPALILALGTGIALPAIPTLARSFNVSFGVASGVVTMFLLGNFLGPLLSAAIGFLVAGSHSFPELLVLRFLNGFGAQMWLMARLAAISHNAEASQRGRLVSWMFGMDSTGKLAGPVVGGFIASDLGARAPFVVYAVLALVAIVPTVLFAKDTPRRDEVAAKTPGAPPRKLTIREIVMPRLPYFGVALFAGLTRGPVGADLLHLYAAFAYHLGPRQIGFLATTAVCISMPIALTAGWMMDRFGRKRTMVPGFTGVAFAMLALAASAFLHLSLTWYVVLFLIGIAVQALTGGSVQTVGADVAPPEARGTFLGLWRFAGQGGTLVGPIVFAVLADELNYGSSFLFIAGSAAIVAFLIVRYIPETRTAT